MKKCKFVLLATLSVFFLLLWFSCNPFEQQQAKGPQVENLLDETERLIISSSMILVNGSTWDGGGETIKAVIGDGAHVEFPVFKIINGSVRNITIDTPPFECIQLSGGNSTVQNVTLLNPNENAVSLAKDGTYLVSDLTANNCSGNLFRIMYPNTATFESIKCNSANTVIRQYAGTTWKTVVYLKKADLTGITNTIMQSESSETMLYYNSVSCNLPANKWWTGNFIVIPY